MTGLPMNPQDLISSLGPGSPAAQQQLDIFNSGRDAAYQMAAQYQAARQGMMQQAQPAGLTAPMAVGQTPAAQPLTPQTSDPDLMAAASYWGIPQGAAATMPRQQLIDTVNQYRQASRPADGTLTAAVADVASVPAQVAIGAGEAITGGLQHLPVVGEWLGRSQLLQQADQKLRQTEEAVRSSTSQSFQWVESGANIAGNIGTMLFPGELAWSAAGKIGAVTPFVSAASPIARAAFQGGVAAFLTEGAGSGTALAHLSSGAGMDQQDKQNLMRVGMAVGAGSLMGAAFNALSTKVAKSFVSPQLFDSGPNGAAPPPAGPPGSVPAGMQDQSGAWRMGGPAVIGPERQLMAGPGPSSPYTSHLDQLQSMASDTSLPDDQRAQAQMMLNHLGNAPAPTAPALNVQQANGVASQLTKAATIVQSPDFPEIAGRTQIGDGAAAQAALATNPGGTNIVSGITDPATFVQGLGSNVRFANRGTRLDAIVSDDPISDKAVGEYEQFGMFSGQRALLPNGVEGQITDLNPGVATVKPVYGGPEWHVSTGDLMPKVNSAAVQPVPQLWDQFQSYVDQRVANTSAAMGGAISPEQLMSVRQQNLGTYMENFMTDAGIASDADRAKVRSYFNVRYVDSFKDQAPVEAMFNDAMHQAAASASGTATPLQPLTALDQSAATKGFTAIPDGANGRILLKDNVTTAMPGAPATVPPAPPTILAFDSVDAAQAYVKGLDRDLPDITPASVTPPEVAGMISTEPTQEMNLNAQHEQHLDRALDEIDPQGIMGLQVAAQLQPPGAIMQKANQYINGMAKFTPMTSLMSNVDTSLRQMGMDTGLLTDFTTILQQHDLNTNFKQPFIQRAGAALSQIDESKLVSGQATLIHEITDPAARQAAYEAAGFRPEEVAAMDQLGSVFKDMFPHTQLDPMREIMQYLPRVAMRQSLGDMASNPWDEDGLNEVTQPFYEYMRTGNLNVRELDPRNLASYYINSLGWKLHMQDTYSQIADKWQNIAANVPQIKPFTDLMGNWLQVVKHGYNPADDAALDTIHAVSQLLLGNSVTRDQAKNLFNFSLDTSQAALLGFRPHVLVRDGLRMLYALPQVGTDLLSTMRNYATDAGARQDLWDRGLAKGWTQLDRSSVQPPAYFETGTGAVDPTGTTQVDPNASLRMQVLQHIYTGIADKLPSSFRDPNPGQFSPLYWIGKQAETMKMLVGNAQYDKTIAALGDYHDAGETADPKALLSASGVGTLPEAYQNAFLQHVAASGDDAAATFAARSMVDLTMFRYGALENPQISRTFAGRIGLQLGNFGIHTYQYLKNAAVNNPKALLLLGGVSYALHAAKEATQWDFGKLNPVESLGFSGGPWLQPALQIAQGVGGAVGIGLGAEGSTQKYDAQAVSGLGTAFSSAADMFNPISGITRTIGGIGQAIESPTPGQAFTRLGVTGEVGAGVDVSNARANYDQRALAQSMPLQQQPASPVRQSSYGYGTIPSQQPVFPPNVTGSGAPPYSSGYQPVPSQVPPPGGSANSYRPVAPDTTPINFPAPQGQANSYPYDSVVSALHGNPGAEKYFAPDEVQYLHSLQGVPTDIAAQAFRDYMQRKTQADSGPQMTQRYPGGSGTPPASSGSGSPGGGAMF